MKLNYTSLFAAALLWSAGALNSIAQETPKPAAEKPATEKLEALDKELVQLVRDVMEVSQVRGAMETSITSMVAQGKKAAGANASKLPETFWPELEKELRKRLPELMDELVPLYASHFTKPELSEMIAFYKTPTGKKLVEKQPLIVQGSMIAGSKWGEKIGKDVAQRLLKKEN